MVKQAIRVHRMMLRRAITRRNPSLGAAAAPGLAAGGAGRLSRTKRAISRAMTNPGIAAIQKAARQFSAWARAMSRIGPSTEANSDRQPLMIRPVFSPMRLGEEVSAIRVSTIGGTGPSAMPMNRRAPISTANEVARPDTKEQQENTITATISRGLRRPIRSDSRPAPMLVRAQVIDRADETRPT